jgi:hypothetical protein
MIMLSDTAFHAAEGDPTHLKRCQRGEWQDRMLVETVLSMLTLVCHFKKAMHPTFKGVWHSSAYFEVWGVVHTTSGQCLVQPGRKKLSFRQQPG